MEITKYDVTQRVKWVVDIVDWCRDSLQELSYCAWDRTKQNEIRKEASDSKGHWA